MTTGTNGGDDRQGDRRGDAVGGGGAGDAGAAGDGAPGGGPAPPGGGAGGGSGESDPGIRRARPADVDRIVLFNRAMARETEGRELDRAVLRAGVERLMEEPRRGVYWVAELEGEVAAQLLVTTEWSDWRNAEVWWIQSVYVSREHRREGLYRALHAAVRRAAREAGAAGLRLYVDRDNLPAQETYASLGMRRSNYRMYEEMWK